MLYAIDSSGQKVLASRHGRAACPCCAAPVIAKVGRIVTPHWAHVAGQECDPWHEPETEWHAGWKRLARADAVEVALQHEGERHRADIVRTAGQVIELQRSGITAETIEQRNDFYNRFGRTTWIFYARPFAHRVRLACVPGASAREHGFQLSWSRGTHFVASRGAEVFWDFGTAVLMRVTYGGAIGEQLSPSKGRVHLTPRAEFLLQYLRGVLDVGAVLAALPSWQIAPAADGETDPAPQLPSLPDEFVAAHTERLRVICEGRPDPGPPAEPPPHPEPRDYLPEARRVRRQATRTPPYQPAPPWDRYSDDPRWQQAVSITRERWERGGEKPEGARFRENVVYQYNLLLQRQARP